MTDIKTTQGRDRTAFPRSHTENPLILVWLFSSTVAKTFYLVGVVVECFRTDITYILDCRLHVGPQIFLNVLTVQKWLLQLRE